MERQNRCTGSCRERAFQGVHFEAVVFFELTTFGPDNGVKGVDTRRVRTPVLVIYYNRYLTNSDCAMFIKRVARRYSNASLERLVMMGDHTTRRAAVLALSLMGDYASNPVLGRTLV